MATTSPTAPRPAPSKDATPPAPAGTAANHPVAVFRFESVSAAVFAEPLKTPKGNVLLLSVSLRRSYKDADDTWQSTHSLRAGDLLPAALALMKCYEFVSDAQAKDASGK